MLSAEREEEIADLAAHYGTPRRLTIELKGRPFNPISSTDRIGEVCMAIRRTNGKLITAVKTFYPAGAFRLLTGGIEVGEDIKAALLRETQEETNLDVVVRQFLAVIEYTLTDQPSGQQTNAPSTSDIYHFVTFAFLLYEIGGTLQSMDPHEQLGAFHEIEIEELPALADTLEHIGGAFDLEIQGHWGDWGRFRAVVHRAVYDALTNTR